MATLFDKDQPEIEYQLSLLNISFIPRRNSENLTQENVLKYNSENLIYRRVFNLTKNREAQDGKEIFFKTFFISTVFKSVQIF